MKKTLAIILSLVMVFALLPVSAFADDGPKPYDPEDFVSAYISAYEVDSEGNYSGVDYYIFDTDPEAELNELEGVRYEPETNTLYLDNLEYPELVFETNGMGDDFTVFAGALYRSAACRTYAYHLAARSFDSIYSICRLFAYLIPLTVHMMVKDVLGLNRPECPKSHMKRDKYSPDTFTSDLI